MSDWVTCPYCSKKIFPLDHDTVIRNLRMQCKRSRCHKIFIVNTDERQGIVYFPEN